MQNQFKKEVAECMLRDRGRLLQQLQKFPGNDVTKMQFIQDQILLAKARKQARIDNCPEVEFTMDLPIYAATTEIRKAIAQHQVIVVCGETGSGKTTQLPQICLSMGRGIDGVIGHTQPRRIAAKTVAQRIAEELKVPLGNAVGFRIRHTDITTENTYIKLMTDGILLAELQQDKLLHQYDTIIIDEAHERSLNIDFILGYLRRLLPARPDLKLIITSATIDIERFSRHFHDAPVIEVSGRTFPVEVRYRPSEDFDQDTIDDDTDEQVLLSAIRELSLDSRGDILIFLEGEREIHETARFLDKQHLKNTDILPLYSRLSSARQARIFQPHKRRHIILATNVAETSLTIPGIHYVIDRGYARVSRYSRNSKVQQLPVEKISQAAAEQRAGRCGRTANGICIRLYSEADFISRPRYTEPEILRTNLAAVILQMKSLDLGDIHDFPFIDKPDIRFINDGLRLLKELQAIDKSEDLTGAGRQLARLPIDPRLGRILLAAGKLGCVSEILIIISALSCQDPRERPLDMQEKADIAHAQFMDERSDFLFYLNVWNFYHRQSRLLSHNQLQKMCRQNFLSYIRIREWKEIYKQLQEMLADMHIYFNIPPAGYDIIHSALLYGLLDHIARKSDDKLYTGARGIRVSIFPGSGQFTRLPKWIIAGELMHTTRLYARTVAAINPRWLIKPAAHLVQREYFEPYWDTRSQQVFAHEKTSLYGLVLVADQKISYGRINPEEARHIFIREALVGEKLHISESFLTHNNKIITDILNLEKKSRRRDILNEQALFDFYDDQVPAGIYNGPAFLKWYLAAKKENEKILYITRDKVMYHGADSVTDKFFPDNFVINSTRLPLTYEFAPANANDGINLDIPLLMLNQVNENQLQYVVPGILEEKVTCMLKALPKQIRKTLVPVPETAKECIENMDRGTGVMYENLAAYLFRTRGIKIPDNIWQSISLPEHLKINIRVIDENNHVLAQGRDIEILKADLAEQVQAGLSTIASGIPEREGITRWDFGDLPVSIRMKVNNITVQSYPALVDCGDSVSIRLFDTSEKSLLIMQSGLRQLFMLVLRKDFNYLKKNLLNFDEMSMYYAVIGNSNDLRNDLLRLIASEVFLPDKADIRCQEDFEKRCDTAIVKLVSEANRLCLLVHDILQEFHNIRQLLAGPESYPVQAENTITAHLDSLVYPGFLAVTPMYMLEKFPRYLAAIKKRLEKLCFDPGRDKKLYLKLKPFWDSYKKISEYFNNSGISNHELAKFRYMLEEYRVSLFAQDLGTAIPVSAERLLQQQNNLMNIKPGSV